MGRGVFSTNVVLLGKLGEKEVGYTVLPCTKNAGKDFKPC
jgi:hypothetical protein